MGMTGTGVIRNFLSREMRDSALLFQSNYLRRDHLIFDGA